VLNSKMYLKVLFFILGMIVTTTIGYAYYFSKNYPLPITNRISFDAKLQFIREHIDPSKVDTIVVGSSLALNNVQGAVLEEESKVCKGVLNLSMWSIGAPQVEQLLEVSDAFPNLKRIIYSGQFSDFGNKLVFKDFDSDFMQKYMTNNLNPIAYSDLLLNACKDISFCLKRQEEWKSNYGMNNKFAYLKFDHTGSAPLHIYGKDIVKERWKNPHAPVQIPEAFQALIRIAKKASNDKVKFYFIQQPYRQPLIDAHPAVKLVMKKFARNVNLLIAKEGGKFFNLHEKLHLSDDYFADRSHLNDKGSKIGSKEIAKFIDKSEEQ